MKKIFHILLVLGLFLTSGCATAPKNDPVALAAYEAANDPLEPMNRAIFAFNLAAHDYVFKPAIKGYRAITTKEIRTSVSDFLANLKAPLTIVNDLLQFNFGQAGIDTSRFVLNSTLGFFGFFDVAEKMGLAPNNEGFGITFGVWGVPSGPYLVLPLLGPSNVRDVTGIAANFAFDPLSYGARQNNNSDLAKTLDILKVLEGVSAYDSALDIMEAGRQTSLDFYAYMRTSYFQYRQKLIADAKGEKIDLGESPLYYFSLDDDSELDYEFHMD